jgi:hypothetical protein
VPSPQGPDPELHPDEFLELDGKSLVRFYRDLPLAPGRLYVEVRWVGSGLYAHIGKEEFLERITRRGVAHLFPFTVPFSG